MRILRVSLEDATDLQTACLWHMAAHEAQLKSGPASTDNKIISRSCPGEQCLSECPLDQGHVSQGNAYCPASQWPMTLVSKNTFRKSLCMLYQAFGCSSCARLTLLCLLHPALPCNQWSRVLLQGAMRRAGPVQGVVPPQQAVPGGAGQVQGLQGGSQAQQGPWRRRLAMGLGGPFWKQRQGPQQPLQQWPVTMQLAGQGIEITKRQGGGLGSSRGGHASRQAPGQVSGKALWLNGNGPNQLLQAAGCTAKLQFSLP